MLFICKELDNNFHLNSFSTHSNEFGANGHFFFIWKQYFSFRVNVKFIY